MEKFKDLYKIWEIKSQPSKTTARMTRSTLKYIAKGLNYQDWEQMPLVQLNEAMVILDSQMAKNGLTSQSKSNYRGYLRRLYKFADQEGLEVNKSNGKLWPQIESNNELPKRNINAYDRFIRWAIGNDIWQTNIAPDDVLNWALFEKSEGNVHWRKDYRRLQEVWQYLSNQNGFQQIEFKKLPEAKNSKYGVPFQEWPKHLKKEWEIICKKASAPLRNGGLRPWRKDTQDLNLQRFQLFLGWYIKENPDTDLTSESWQSLLTADNCQSYLNWLVNRSGNSHLTPAHTSLLRMIRGLHKFIFNSEQKIIDAFDDLANRCEVVERDKASRMVPYSDLRTTYDHFISKVKRQIAKKGKSSKESCDLAKMEVEAIILGILIKRVLRSKNIRLMKLNQNLIRTEDGFLLKYSCEEMKGHRKFETTCPTELIEIFEDYLKTGYKLLHGKEPKDSDHIILNTKGKVYKQQAFSGMAKWRDPLKLYHC